MLSANTAPLARTKCGREDLRHLAELDFHSIAANLAMSRGLTSYQSQLELLAPVGCLEGESGFPVRCRF